MVYVYIVTHITCSTYFHTVPVCAAYIGEPCPVPDISNAGWYEREPSIGSVRQPKYEVITHGVSVGQAQSPVSPK